MITISEKESLIDGAIREYLETLSEEKKFEIKDNLKYNLEFRNEFRHCISSLGELICGLINNLEVDSIITSIMEKGAPKYRDTIDMQYFYLNHSEMINYLQEDFKEKTNIRDKFDFIKQIIERPALLDSLDNLEEKEGAKSVKI